MILYLLLAFVVLAYGARHKAGFYDDCLGKAQTSAINGFFICLVFVSHIGFYFLDRVGYAYVGAGDALYVRMLRYFCQLHVASFLFYSGFGVAERSNKSGVPYVRKMPKVRILNTWLNYAVAVCVFVGVGLLLGCDVTLLRFVKALFRGWGGNLGNPTWYVFCICYCYAATYVGFLVCKNRLAALSAVAFLILCYHGWAYKFAPHQGWYNTVWVYPLGIAVSFYREKIMAISYRYYWLAMALGLVAFLSVYNFPYGHYCLRNNVLAGLFVMLIMLVTMKVRLHNRCLEWLGAHLHPIYLYHTIFFLLACHLIPADKIGVLVAHGVVILSFAGAIAVARCWDFFGIRLK